MKLCTCKLKKKEVIDSKAGIIVSGVVLLGFLIVLSIVSFVALGAVLITLALLYSWYMHEQVKLGHSKPCAARQAVLKILDIGSLFSL
jgi:amino acid permease